MKTGPVGARNRSHRPADDPACRRPRAAAPAAAGSTDPDVQRLEQDLSEKLGARVAIQHTRSGKGKVVVNYNSLDELDGILEHIR